MSTFDDLEHDQHGALADLTEVLDVDAGVRDLLQELSDAQAIHQIADVLDLDAGAAAALATAGLPAPDAPPSVAAAGHGDMVLSPGNIDRIRRSFAPRSAGRSFLVRLLATIAALFRPIHTRSSADEPAAYQQAVQLNIALGRHSTEHSRSARTLDEICGEIADLLEVVRGAYMIGRKKVSPEDPRTRYLDYVDTVGLGLQQIMDGLSSRNISLDDAVAILRAAEVAVRRIRRLAEGWPRPVASHAKSISLLLLALSGTAASIVALTVDWTNLNWVVPTLLPLFTVLLSAALVSGRPTLRLWAVNRALTRAAVGGRLALLKHDVRRLFDNSDEFSEERASH